MNVMARRKRLRTGPSLREEPIDVVVRDFRERRVEFDVEVLFLSFDLGGDVLEDLVELGGRAADPEADQAERRALVEDDDEDHALRDDRDVDVVLLPFVEENRELLLA